MPLVLSQPGGHAVDRVPTGEDPLGPLAAGRHGRVDAVGERDPLALPGDSHQLVEDEVVPVDDDGHDRSVRTGGCRRAGLGSTG